MSYQVVAPEREGDVVIINGIFRGDSTTTIRYRLPDGRGSMACGLVWFWARFTPIGTLPEIEPSN